MELSKLQFNINGVLVEAMPPGVPGEVGPVSVINPKGKYRGVAYGQPWPLSALLKPHLYQNHSIPEYGLLKEVEARIMLRPDVNGDYSPQVLEDFDVAKHYTERCRLHGLPIRVLLCSTPAPQPKMDQSVVTLLKDSSQRLGYDYALFTCDVSAVHDDLQLHPLYESTSELGGLANRLNAYGLFEERSDLEQFMALENSTDDVREPGAEPLDGYWPYELWELDLSCQLP